MRIGPKALVGLGLPAALRPHAPKKGVGVPPIPTRSTPKIIAKNAGGDILVFSQMAAADGSGLMTTLKKDIVTSVNSVGGSAPLTRCTDTQRVSEAYAFQHASTASSGSWTEDLVVIGTTGSNIKCYLTQELNAYQEYAFDGDFVDVGFFRTPGGATTYTVKVDGVTQSVPSLVGANGVVMQRWSGFGPGAHTLRITQTGPTNAAGRLRVCGINFVRLGGETYAAARDSYAYGSPNASGQNNFTQSNGAQDYALMRASNNQWAGSYHGGETLDSIGYTLDGVSIDVAGAAAGSTIGIGSAFVISQTTHFGWDVTDIYDTVSTTSFIADGTWRFAAELLARPPAGVTLSNAYTQMTTTLPSFTKVQRPIVITTDTNGQAYALPPCSYVRQQDPDRGWTIESYFASPAQHVGTYSGPHIEFYTGVYAKLYDGPVTGNSLAVTSLSIDVTKVFRVPA